MGTTMDIIIQDYWDRAADISSTFLPTPIDPEPKEVWDPEQRFLMLMNVVQGNAFMLITSNPFKPRFEYAMPKSSLWRVGPPSADHAIKRYLPVTALPAELQDRVAVLHMRDPRRWKMDNIQVLIESYRIFSIKVWQREHLKLENVGNWDDVMANHGVRLSPNWFVVHVTAGELLTLAGTGINPEPDESNRRT